MSTEHSLYARLSDEPVALTEIIHPNLIVDLDADGGVVGVEVLRATGVTVDGVVVAGERRPSFRTSSVPPADRPETVEDCATPDEAVEWLRSLGNDR